MPQLNVPPTAVEFAEESDGVDDDPGIATTGAPETIDDPDESARSEPSARGYAVAVLAVV